MPGTNDITYISIHAPRMGSDMRRANSSPRRPISIHAPRMGSDAVFAMPQVWWRISIHAPRMGSDPAVWVSIIATLLFQSTLPGWGATGRETGSAQDTRNFNPRSPDGERQACYLSIFRRITISIHAPRMGSDHNIFSPLSVKAYFNPRSPDGERPGILPLHSVEQRFQSTLPGWGATNTHCAKVAGQSVFQSTLPGWGATISPPRCSAYPANFNPRSPDGERLRGERG